MIPSQTGNTGQQKPSALDSSSNAKRRRAWKRARVACTWCRERKVRCDVSILGTPCTNCKIDCHKCAVRNHPNLLPSNLDSAQPTQPEQNRALTWATENQVADAAVNYTFPQVDSNSFLSIASDIRLDGSGVFPFAAAPRLLPSVIAPYPECPPSNVPFSYYQFVRSDGLHTLPSDDVNFLELKGCLRVPDQLCLDVFVHQYFLHVHPCLPVLNEAEFWQMYLAHKTGKPSPHRVSLFVLQALLSASCVFVPMRILSKIGFDDTRTARSAFYIRAKLLFDLGGVKSPMDKAQGAILLTYQTSAIDLTAGTRWLSTAIQFGKAANAHLYGCEAQRGHSERLIRKRLWWCILLRDRILPLALRRQVKLIPDQVNPLTDYLDETDLRDEIHNSQVYSAIEKRQLIRILSLQCQLAVSITNLLRIVYAPIWGSLPVMATDQDFSKALDEIDEIKCALGTWANMAERHLGPNSTSTNLHGSVLLFTKMTYMYYDSARLAASHYEALIWKSQYWYSRECYLDKFQSIRVDIEDAVLKMTNNVKEFIMRGLACHLPISAVAHTALPLILTAVDAKLSSTRVQLMTRQRRMHFYNEMMRVLRSLYDAADNVCGFIENVVSSVNLPGESNPPLLVTPILDGSEVGETNDASNNTLEQIRQCRTPGSRIKNVCDLFVRQPRDYLRLAMLLDYSLSRGQYPQAEDIRELFQRLNLLDGRSMPSRPSEPITQPPESDTSALPTTLPRDSSVPENEYDDDDDDDDDDNCLGNFGMSDLISSDLHSTLQANLPTDESLLNESVPSENQLNCTNPTWVDSMLKEMWDTNPM